MRWAVPLVLVALLLAGCAQKAAEPTAATAPATNVTAAAVNDDGSKPQMAVDTGHMPHMHDYWKGRERVTLFDGDIQPDTENATGATFYQVITFHDAVVGGTLWRLPDGQIVYEGTGAMELTTTWSDPRVTGIRFLYSSADSAEFKPGGTFVSGRPFTLPVTPKQTDMPHSKTSRWTFGFGPDKSPGALMGPFHLKIDIIRMNDIMLFPGHPDLWNGTHERVQLDADHKGSQVSYVKRGAQPANNGTFNEDLVALDHPVPMETLSMKVTVTITAATSTPGKVTSFGFFYRGADSTQLLRCSVKPINGTLPSTISWTIPVTMESSDSPYDSGSAWRIFVEPHVQFTDADPPAGGMTDVDYAYHAKVVAFDAASENAEHCRNG